MTAILPVSPHGRGAGEDCGEMALTSGPRLSATMTRSGRQDRLTCEDGPRCYSNRLARRKTIGTPFQFNFPFSILIFQAGEK
jgi:hypothetical protein